MMNEDLLGISNVQMDAQNAEDISEEILAIDWTLVAPDLEFVYRYRGSENLLRLAIQLCALRKTGRFIQEYSSVPIKVVQYLARQLELEPVLMVAPADRKATEYKYRQLIRDYLGFHDFSQSTTLSLTAFIENKVQHEALSQEVLLEASENFLVSQKIILPPRMKLGRIVASIKNKTQQKIYDKINERISPKLRKQLNQILNSSRVASVISLQGLKRSPPAPSVKVIHRYLDRLKWLEDVGIPTLDLSSVHVSWVEIFYSLTCTYNIRDLRRMPASKRYALLVCFLSEAHKIVLDHLVDLNEKMLQTKTRESRNKFKNKVAASRHDAKIAEGILIDTVKAMYKQKETEDIMLSQFIASLNNAAINKAVEDCEANHRYEDNGLLRELQRRYPYLRKYTGQFFNLDFKAGAGSETLLEAINILRQLNDGTLKNIANDAPCDFVKSAWKKSLHNPDGTINQRTWELALYFATEEALSRGDLYLLHSKNHCNFWHTVYDDKTWQQQKDAAYEKLKLPTRFGDILRNLVEEFNTNVQHAREQLLQKKDFAYIDDNGELKLHKDDALFIPESVKKLRQQIESRLPMIRIEKLLEEVDAMTGFSKSFVPQKGFIQRSHIPRQHLYAVLLAHATNMGLYGMAHSLENITIEELRHASRWLIYDDVLKAATVNLVNKHCKLPITKIYGAGRRSGSDAKRYAIRASSLLASFYPRHFGYYDKVISIYTHMSDIYSVFSTLVISCGVREALYVLTGLLNHDTDLNPEYHCTDTHGFTHHIFALCYLLGISFQPRLKDLSSQQLFKLDKNTNYGKIESIFAGSVDIELIAEQWDNFVRIAASLKSREYPAHLIIEKLAKRIDIDRTARALVELGKLTKTIFVLRYISDEKFRHMIQLQLNRGEHRHALVQHVFFADQGIFKTSDYEEIMNKSSCLSLISNAILYWNTVQISKIVEKLKAEGYPVTDEDLAKISLLPFKHIVVTGIYRFSEVEAA